MSFLHPQCLVQMGRTLLHGEEVVFGYKQTVQGGLDLLMVLVGPSVGGLCGEPPPLPSP